MIYKIITIILVRFIKALKYLRTKKLLNNIIIISKMTISIVVDKDNIFFIEFIN